MPLLPLKCLGPKLTSASAANHSKCTYTVESGDLSCRQHKAPVDSYLPSGDLRVLIESVLMFIDITAMPNNSALSSALDKLMTAVSEEMCKIADGKRSGPVDYTSSKFVAACVDDIIQRMNPVVAATDMVKDVRRAFRTGPTAPDAPAASAAPTAAPSGSRHSGSDEIMEIMGEMIANKMANIKADMMAELDQKIKAVMNINP
jgi:hypothetical protein